MALKNRKRSQIIAIKKVYSTKNSVSWIDIADLPEKRKDLFDKIKRNELDL